MSNKDEFLPSDYEIPDSSTGYMKFEEGENRFRVLSSAIIGWESWVKDKEGNRRPKRWRMEEQIPAEEIGDDPKHFWAFVVWNYKTERVQILEITQKGIMRSIKALTKNEKWGDPKNYDIVVTRTGKTMQDTEYQVTPDPKEDLDKGIKKFYEDLEIDLEALYRGEDPFTKEGEFNIPEK